MTTQLWREHAEMLDSNWQVHHDACMGAIQAALAMPDASVPDLVAGINRLRDQRASPERASVMRAQKHGWCVAHVSAELILMVRPFVRDLRHHARLAIWPDGRVTLAGF